MFYPIVIEECSLTVQICLAEGTLTLVAISGQDLSFKVIEGIMLIQMVLMRKFHRTQCAGQPVGPSLAACLTFRGPTDGHRFLYNPLAVRRLPTPILGILCTVYGCHMAYRLVPTVKLTLRTLPTAVHRMLSQSEALHFLLEYSDTPGLIGRQVFEQALVGQPQVVVQLRLGFKAMAAQLAGAAAMP